MIVKKYLDNNIRFINKNGEYWAVASDVARVLGFRDANTAVRYLPKHVRGTLKERTTSDKAKARKCQDYTVINEKGIYRLIMRSNKPEALDFQDWICDLLVGLRQGTGLQSYDAFDMLDKQHQISVMDLLNNNYEDISDKVYIKANTISNKAVSIVYGFEKMIGKNDMTREMLQLRQIILNDTVQLIITAQKFNMDISISKAIYDKYIYKKGVA
ncbi:phage repressor protein [Staphylococcus succinus]|uniref:BRO-N domain-containing protein n=1 Tax=Staphylococcus succinus TaxID=61015 RepID=UPI000D1DB273|nr:Bro-N domain-containing protein [Staphylococcus succinus]PTJ81247.1 phage repressor protein [Staphylococcus succinus]